MYIAHIPVNVIAAKHTATTVYVLKLSNANTAATRITKYSLLPWPNQVSWSVYLLMAGVTSPEVVTNSRPAAKESPKA